MVQDSVLSALSSQEIVRMFWDTLYISFNSLLNNSTDDVVSSTTVISVEIFRVFDAAREDLKIGNISLQILMYPRNVSGCDRSDLQFCRVVHTCGTALRLKSCLRARARAMPL